MTNTKWTPQGNHLLGARSNTHNADLKAGFFLKDSDREPHYPGAILTDTGHLLPIESRAPATSKFGVLGGNGTSKAGAYQVSTKSGSRIKSYDTCSTGRRAPITVFLFRHDRRHSRSTNSLSFGDFLGSFFSYNPALQSWVKFNAHSPAVLPQ
ncbi:hypothetical protein DFH07DRAFT_766671 [Mycena maculata]|uniref:Uncharacterized protein n=1 Tax=Mycena maculata TaxID=230809 RepID=A0AAD7K2S0_9AGAR|nr:hypothetical protein DFH07DRAFT_766671 [Mycena maculata]